MGRKRPEEKQMPASAEPKLRPVRLDHEPDVHPQLRLIAADSNMSMASYAREAFEKHLREEAKRRGIKP